MQHLDERLKTFDGPMTDSLRNRGARSRGALGYFTVTHLFGPGEHIGLGAETVTRYFPELTATGDDGTMSLAYDQLKEPIIAALGTIVENCRAAANDNFCIELLKKDSLNENSFIGDRSCLASIHASAQVALPGTANLSVRSLTCRLFLRTNRLWSPPFAIISRTTAPSRVKCSFCAGRTRG